MFVGPAANLAVFGNAVLTNEVCCSTSGVKQ